MDFCATCISSSDCLTCNTTDRELYKGKCSCKKGTFEDKDRVCQTCSDLDGCVDCSSTTNCLECDLSSGWVLNHSTNLCECASHYYHH